MRSTFLYLVFAEINKINHQNFISSFQRNKRKFEEGREREVAHSKIATPRVLLGGGQLLGFALVLCSQLGHLFPHLIFCAGATGASCLVKTVAISVMHSVQLGHVDDGNQVDEHAGHVTVPIQEGGKS